MTYSNRFTRNRYYSLPVNVADYNAPIGIKPNDNDRSFHIGINVQPSDSQSQNDLTMVAATAWQMGDAITIDPSGGAPTTYTFDSVGGLIHPGQNNFPIPFGLANLTNDHFESNGSGVDAYNFMGKGKAIDSDYIHTHDLHLMDSNSVFDSGRAFDMFLNGRSKTGMAIEYYSMMPINHKDRFAVDPSRRDSDYGPYPGNVVEISPTQPPVFPIGYDSADRARQVAAEGGGGAPADPESWS